MRLNAIIAEFNPLHQGHVYLMDQAKAQGDLLVILMSGNFSQRGEPTIQDKFTRARQAILAGADLVLTLPVPFAASAARDFARGAIHILSQLPQLAGIYCGGEEIHPDLFYRASYYLKNDHLLAKDLASFLKTGYSYSQSLRLALEKIDPRLGQVFQPNLILALEYYRALEEKKKEDLLRVLPRLDQVQGRPLPSASQIRQNLKGGFSSQAYFPQDPLWSEDLLKERLFSFYRRWALEGFDQLDLYRGYEEGLENRLLKALKETRTGPDFFKAVSSKRYSIPRLSRLLLHHELGIKRDLIDGALKEEGLGLQVLGLSPRGAQYLKGLRGKEDIRFLTKFSQKKALPPFQEALLDLEAKASDLYSLLRGEVLSSDYTQTPYIKP
ncbi:MAG: nucleotidyltransferase family protein [Tissierellia bacterium]|nr:nucleotidyltransferase family protein [Tissierellia bacterium]